MLAARITLPHFSVSSAMSLLKSAGKLPLHRGCICFMVRYRSHVIASRNVAMRNPTVTPAMADQTMSAKVPPRTCSTVPTVPSAPNISHRNATRHEAR
jgi:hypothetical protein